MMADAAPQKDSETGSLNAVTWETVVSNVYMVVDGAVFDVNADKVVEIDDRNRA